MYLLFESQARIPQKFLWFETSFSSFWQYWSSSRTLYLNLQKQHMNPQIIMLSSLNQFKSKDIKHMVCWVAYFEIKEKELKIMSLNRNEKVNINLTIDC